MRGFVLRLIGMLFVLFVWVLIQAIWYIILVYFYSILVAVVGLRKSVTNITENVVIKAVTEWRLDYRLQDLLTKVVPPIAYVCIIGCWIFTALSTACLVKWLVWK